MKVFWEPMHRQKNELNDFVSGKIRERFLKGIKYAVVLSASDHKVVAYLEGLYDGTESISLADLLLALKEDGAVKLITEVP